MMERLRLDVRTSMRSLRGTPVPVLSAMFTLAIATGVNLATFGLIDRALLSPPAAIEHPNQLFTMGFQPPGDRAGSGLMTTTAYGVFTEIRDQVPSIESAAFQRSPTTVMIAGEQRRVNTMVVSGEYFGVLGSVAARGRVITSDDNARGAPLPVAVISHAFWRSALRSDPNVIGRRLAVRTVEYEVVGVMPPGFSGHSTVEVDLWVPFAAALRDVPGWDRDQFRNSVTIVSRLREDANVAAAETQATALVERRVSLRGIIGADVAPSDQRVAWWLGGVSILVLVIGLANTGTLLMVRAARLRFDIAVRSAMGASRARLIAQGLIDAAIIAAGATTIAMLLSFWLDEAVRRVLFPGIIARTSFGTMAVAAASVAGVLGFIVAASVNVWSLPRQLQVTDLAIETHGRSRTKTMTALLLMQTAASVVLLAGAAMFGGSLYRLWSQDFGMSMDDVLIVDFDLGPERLERQDEILERALQQVRQMPGVEMATPIDAIPFSGFNVPPIAVPGRADPPAVGQQLPYLVAATPEFLSILGIQLVEGRLLADVDDRGALVVLVNQSMARGVWPGESAVGKCIRIGFDPDFTPGMTAGPVMPSDRVPCREVVGVVRDIRQRSVLPQGNEDRLMQYFVPLSQVPRPPFASDPQRIRGLMLRADVDLELLAPVVRRAVVGDRTDLPFVRVRPYSELLERQMRPWSMGTTLLGLFSALALAVAAVGLYAAFAHAVVERRREMAIRMAVGARPIAVLGMVLREAGVLAAAGTAIGCVGAVASGRWIESLLFGVEPSDPFVLAAAASAMLIVALLATLLPARSASKSDPSRLLRAQ